MWTRKPTSISAIGPLKRLIRTGQTVTGARLLAVGIPGALSPMNDGLSKTEGITEIHATPKGLCLIISASPTDGDDSRVLATGPGTKRRLPYNCYTSEILWPCTSLLQSERVPRLGS